jgi:glyoxylase-like metal-dependent hydrolase (beta-lactamase superfamily II)
VTCLLTEGHTAGHQSVRVRTESGTYLICGDCCYLRRSLTDEHLPSFSDDRERQLASLRRLGREQAAGATLLFGHDPDQWATIGREGLHPGV